MDLMPSEPSKAIAGPRSIFLERVRALALIPLFALLLLWLSLWLVSPQPITGGPVLAPAANLPAISGLVKAEITKNRFTYLRDFTVTLQLTPTVLGAPPLLTARSDEYARFVMPTLPTASSDYNDYAICWETAGWTANCQSASATPMQVVVTPTDSTRILWGRVAFANGASPWFVDPLFGVTQTVEVLLANTASISCPTTSTIVMSAPTTVWGDYVFVDPPQQTTHLSARFGDLTATSTLTAAKGFLKCSGPSIAVDPLTPHTSKFQLITSPGMPLRFESIAYQNENDETIGYQVDRSQSDKVTPSNKGVVPSPRVYGKVERDCLENFTQRNNYVLRKNAPSACPPGLVHYPTYWRIPPDDNFHYIDGAATWSGIHWHLPQTPGWYRGYLLATDEDGGYGVDSYLVEVITPRLMVRQAPMPSTDYFSKRFPPTPDEAISGSEQYYSTVDPESRRLTLGNWWAVNGFDPQTGEGGIQATYLNHDDLGFGRNMNCLQRGEQVACYVTNYGDVRQEPGSANMAYHDDPSQASATVAMELSPIEREVNADKGLSFSLHEVVKFFVFGGGEANAPRRLKANLDGFPSGEEDRVPYVCLHCHGGQYVRENFKGDLNGASFLPFDMAKLVMPSECDSTVDARCSAERFRQLNQIVRDTSLPNRTTELIDGWYPTADPVQAHWIPPGWESITATTLYDEVIARSCRTCHLNFLSGAAFFNPYDEVKLQKIFTSTVFSPTQTMPQAYIPDYNLWCGTPSDPPPINTALSLLGPFTVYRQCH